MRISLLLLIISFFYSSIIYGQSLSARIINARVEGSEFKWDVEINRTDDWGTGGGNDILGNCDFYFYINSNGFTEDNPALSNIHTALDDNANYSFNTGRAIGNTQCYVALIYDTFGGGTNWYPSLDSWELMFTVSLPIDSASLTSELFWYESSTGFARGNAQPLTATLSISGQSDISLPVELSSFIVEAGMGNISLTWITESEINNKGFEVFRSKKEECEYIMLDSYVTNEDLLGHGNSSTRHTYSFIDNNVTLGQTYWYKIADVDVNGVRTYHGPISVDFTWDDPIADNNIPTEYNLYPNYPNPFNPNTTIKFALTEKEFTKLRIFNSNGQLITILINELISEGIHEIEFDGKNLSSGIYYYQIKTDNFYAVRKMVLIK